MKISGRVSSRRQRFFFIAALLAAAGSGAAQNGPALTLPRVPEGFAIDRVASEPAIRFPMFAAFDDRGRLFVAESSGLDLYAEISALTRKCQVRLLEDLNGDRQFESSKVFADQLVFPMGLVWREGKLFVADPPDLITLEDTDGDGRADRRTVLLTGFGHRDNGSLHGLVFGPDGWLYLTTGEPDGYKLKRPDGSVLEGRSGALLRCRPDGSEVTVLSRGFENLVEVIFTPAGEVIGTDNWFQKPSGGLRDALVHLEEGGLYPYAPDEGTPQPITGLPLPPVARFPAVALSGLVRYRGQAFPAMQGDLFSAQHNTRQVVRHRLHRQGATFRADQFEFVHSDDPDFHPSDVLEDADGSLLLVDTGSWYTQHCPTGRIRRSPAAGAIYRVRQVGAKPLPDPWGRRENPASAAGWIQLLADARPAVRDRAQQALAKGGAETRKALETFLARATNQATRLEALWARAAHPDPIPSGLVGALLQDRDAEIVASTARLLTLRPDRTIALELRRLLPANEREPAVRLAAALALAHCGNAEIIPALWQALAEANDPFLAHGLIYAAHRLGDEPALRTGLIHPHPRVQEAALLLLSQPPRAQEALQAAMLLDRATAADAGLRQTALRLLRQRSEWAEQATELLRSWERQGEPAAAAGELWAGRDLILAFEKAPGTQAAVAAGLRGTNLNLRVRLLETIPHSALAEPPPQWLDAILDGLRDQNVDLILLSIRAASRWPRPVFEASLQNLTEDARRPKALRLEAARALIERRPVPGTNLFEFLIEQLKNPADPISALSVAELISRCRLSDAQLLRAFAALGEQRLVSPSLLLRGLHQSASEQDALALVELIAAKLQSGWRPSEVEFGEFLQRLPATARRRAESLTAMLKGDLESQRLRLSRLLPLLKNGDPERGRILFFGAKVGCSLCHALGDQGGRVGPDLTRIGAVRSGPDLIEAIVFPSATFAQGYESYWITTREGAEWTGILVEQTTETVTLRETSGAERHLRRDEITELRRHSVSLMPEGLDTGLSEEEFRDLLAFLQELK